MAPDVCSPLIERHASVRKPVILALLLAVLFGAVAVAQTTDKEWQTRAVQKYPDLGIQGSDFNKRFVAEHNKRRQTTPAFFADPRWPLLLADELATAAPTPPPKPATLPQRLSAKWHALSYPTRLAATVGGVGLILCASLSVVRRFHRWRRWKRICADSAAYFALADKSKTLPTVPTTVTLQHHEAAVYCALSSLFETRADRQHESRFAGVRVAPGLWVGGSRGRSVTTHEWSRIDSGTLTVTNQRVVFDGRREPQTIPLKRIVSVACLRDSVELAIDGRRKNMVFDAANPLILATLIHLCSEGHVASSRHSGPAPNGAASQPPPHDPPPRKSRERPAPEKPKVESEDLMHARTLGLSGKFNFSDVKKHYHDRIREYHPDKVASLGPKLRELAEAESKRINAAYEHFARKHQARRKA